MTNKNEMLEEVMTDVAVWFSCGAASACALKLTTEKYKNVRAIYNPVREEHPDNMRFLRDVEKWCGVKIEIAGSMFEPNQSAENVWKRVKYMAGIHGAPCTAALKIDARIEWEERNQFDGWHVFGFPSEERHRHDRRVSKGAKVIPVLIDAGMSKQDCFDMVRNAGIDLPAIYSIGSKFGSGYPNANCIGCVKASTPTYWNHVRETFPDIFKRRAELSRKLGVKLTRCHPKYLAFCAKKNGEWYDTRTNQCLHITDKKQVNENYNRREFF